MRKRRKEEAVAIRNTPAWGLGRFLSKKSTCHEIIMTQGYNLSVNMGVTMCACNPGTNKRNQEKEDA